MLLIRRTKCGILFPRKRTVSIYCVLPMHSWTAHTKQGLKNHRKKIKSGDCLLLLSYSIYCFNLLSLYRLILKMRRIKTTIKARPIAHQFGFIVNWNSFSYSQLLQKAINLQRCPKLFWGCPRQLVEGGGVPLIPSDTSIPPIVATQTQEAGIRHSGKLINWRGAPQCLNFTKSTVLAISETNLANCEQNLKDHV